jgi:serine protease inhibitor
MVLPYTKLVYHHYMGWAGLIGLIVLLAACEAPHEERAAAVTPSAIAVAEATSAFGFDLFAELLQDHPEENVLVSPTSLASSLGMAHTGADGATKKAIAEVLHVGRLTDEQVTEGRRDLLALENGEPAGISVCSANSIWIRQGTSLEPSFIEAIETTFLAHAEPLNLGDPAALKKINDWIGRETKGQVPAILNEIHPDAVAYLVNAVHFKGQWQSKFDPEKSKEADFRLDDKQAKRVMMMSQSGTFAYHGGQSYEAVRLPYKNERYAMVLVLPRPGSSVDELATDLAGSGWHMITAQLNARKVEVSLPRFKLSSRRHLKQPLSKLGMARAFDPAAAEFGAMARAGGIWIDDVVHQAVLEVDEEGTTAAAATATTMAKSAAARFVADRPFLFAVEDSEAKAILFLGVVRDPTRG